MSDLLGNEAQSQAPVAPESTPAAPTLPDVPLAKKYQGDWMKANEGYFNAVNELTRKNETVNQLAERAAQLEMALQTMLGGRPQQPDPMAQLGDELGLPNPEPLRQGVRQELQAALQEMFGPLVKQIEADEKLSTEIDNFEQLRTDARRFMHENQEVASTFNAVRNSNPEAAWKYAIREMLISRGGVPVASSQGAGIPTGGGARREPGAPDVDYSKAEAEAAEYAQKTGDTRAYRNARFAGTSIEEAGKRALNSRGW